MTLDAAVQTMIDAGLRSPRRVLVLLACMKKVQTVKGLSEQLKIQKPAIVGAINYWEKHGILRRERDAADMRNVFLHVTPQGRLYAEDLRKNSRQKP